MSFARRDKSLRPESKKPTRPDLPVNVTAGMVAGAGLPFAFPEPPTGFAVLLTPSVETFTGRPVATDRWATCRVR